MSGLQILRGHAASYFRELQSATIDGWNRFWFTPSDPATISLIRILAGAMLLYTHLVWTLGLGSFIGNGSRLSPEFVDRFHDPLQSGIHFAWSFWTGAQSPAVAWGIHIVCLVVFAMLMLGFYTRVVSVLAWLITLAYAHRLPGTQFGLDQINIMLAMYLMISPSGARYSIDRLIAKKKNAGPVQSVVSATVAVRLIQIHLCIIYLFAGFGKLQGTSWWDGTAIWLSVANLEYQSVDLTGWLCRFPRFVNLLTHIALVWEVTYIALIWPRMTRPIMLLMAIPLHLGIAFCLGMVTFGTVMLIANLAFVSPLLIRALFGGDES